MDREPFEVDVLAKLEQQKANGGAVSIWSAAADASADWREQGRDPPMLAWLDRMGARHRAGRLSGLLLQFAVCRAVQTRSQRRAFFFIWLHVKALRLARWM